MVRASVIALAVFLTLAGAARAADPQVWEPAGPIATSVGMTAVATDPDNPKVVWLGSATTVWVSEDEGKTFHLVLQLARAAGLVRDTGSQPTETPDEQDGDTDSPEAQDQLEDQLEDQGLTEDDTFVLDTSDSDDRDDEGGGGEDDDDDTERRFGVSRLRVQGDVVYVCTSRGLYTIGRAARRVGTGREVRFGRKVAVNDVAVAPDGSVWIAADTGLVQLGPDGIGRPARGLEEDVEIRAVVVAEGRLVAATARGLRLGATSFDGFERFTIGGREEAGVQDLLVEANARLLVAGDNQVARVLAKPGEAPMVEESWSVPGASRLAFGRDGARWAVGGKGAWRLTADQGFQRQTEGLFDRRLRDVAAGYGPDAALWSVGRSGAWRLVSDPGRAYSASAERLAKTALEGFPNDDKVLAWAIHARGTGLDQIDRWVLEERLAWLLPKVELTFRWNRQRQEDRLLIPVLDRRLLDAVEVRPIDDDFRVIAYWDLMPAITAALESTRGTYESSRIRARKSLDRVREVVMPIYQAWAKKRIDLAAAEDLTLASAVKEMLAIQRLEADLHVYTDGHFPVQEVAPSKPPPKP